MISVRESVEVRNPNLQVMDMDLLSPVLSTTTRHERNGTLRNRFIIELRLMAAVDTLDSAPEEYLVEDACKQMQNYLYGEIEHRLERIQYILQADTYHGQRMLSDLLRDLKEKCK